LLNNKYKDDNIKIFINNNLNISSFKKLFIMIC